MDFGLKDIARAVSVVVVIAIFVYLYYERRNTLKRKLNGRDYNQVLHEQARGIMDQTDSMERLMHMYMSVFANGGECRLEELYKTLEPLYAEMAQIADKAELIEELFGDNIMKSVGNCQSIFNDFGFQSYFFDMLEAFGADPAPPYAEKAVKPAYQAFANAFEATETVALQPEKYAKLMELTAAFGEAKQQLFISLEQKLSSIK